MNGSQNRTTRQFALESSATFPRYKEDQIKKALHAGLSSLPWRNTYLVDYRNHCPDK